MGLPTIAVPQYELTIPSSGKQVKYRPFLVREEKILLLAMESEDTTQILNATKSIIENCVYDDIDIREMPTFDMEYIFLQLRGKAKGEIIELKYKCPKCEGEIPIAINIDEIGVITHKDHKKDITLNDELGVMMKYPTMELQAKVEGMDTKQKVDVIFTTVAACIDYIYDKENTYPSKDHTSKEMNDFIESLPDIQFKKLSNFFETSPALKHEVKLHCRNKKGKGKEKKECGYKEPLKLEGLASFFA